MFIESHRKRGTSTWVGCFFFLFQFLSLFLLLVCCWPCIHRVSSVFHSLLLSVVINKIHKQCSFDVCLCMWQEYIVHYYTIIFMQFDLQNCYRRRLNGMWLKFFSIFFFLRIQVIRNEKKIFEIGFFRKWNNILEKFHTEWNRSMPEELQITKFSIKQKTKNFSSSSSSSHGFNQSICVIHQRQIDR